MNALSSRTQHQQQAGFTLIELVMVIVLISILSYGAASLFFSRDAYSGFIAKNQLLSQAHLAQQVALGMSAYQQANVADPLNPVTLTVGTVANDWVFTLSKALVTNPDPIMVDSSGGILIIDGVTITSGSSQTFTWDTLANLSPVSNHEIRFVGDTTARVCLSASGFAYESQVTCP